VEKPHQIIRLSRYEDARVPVYRNPSAETIHALLSRPLHEHEEAIEIKGHLQGNTLYVWDGFICTHQQMWEQKLGDTSESLKSRYAEQDIIIRDEDGEITVDCWSNYNRHPRLVELRERLAAFDRVTTP